MHIGIDLGTTFSCAAYIAQDGTPKVIPTSDGSLATPSVVWFDGQQAYVGSKAVNMKETPLAAHIFEFVKRDIGKPIEMPFGLSGEEQDSLELAPYFINGYKYGAAGLSALILRKIKIEAILYLQQQGLLDKDINEATFTLDAVITVPAYFGDKERHDTKCAGEAAGLNVIGIINEPTAAALSYGLMSRASKRILVFDLGGGTFDVTLLQTHNDEATALTSDGHNQLGGRDWDRLIEEYLFTAYERKVGVEIPDDKGFMVQRLALQAKFELSEKTETIVKIYLPQGGAEITLYRERTGGEFDMDVFEIDDNFYFEEVSTNLLGMCRRLCNKAVERSGLRWDQIDEVIMTGGSCRMPMIPKLLQELSGRPIKQDLHGFDFDTAVAIGAALYGQAKGNVQDIVSQSIGVRVIENNRQGIQHLIPKDAKLPSRIERKFPAPANAVLDVYEGEAFSPDECIRRGQIELNNEPGNISVQLEIDQEGILLVTADFPPDGRKQVKITNDGADYDERIGGLREKIQAVTINF